MSFPVPVKYKLTATLDNIVVEYSDGQEWEGLPSPPEGGSEPTGTKEITITENGVYTEDVAEYADAEITVNVSGGDTFAEICNGNVNSYESEELIKIPQNTLRSNTTLTSIKIYNCQDIGAYALGGFRGEAIALPSFKGNIYSEGYPFSGSPTLQKIDLGDNLVRIFGNFLSGANKVDTLIIRTKTIPTLQNVNAFNNNVFKSGGTGGSIYIPKVLYDALGTGVNDYTSAANWSTVNGYGTITWKQIEGSEYENYYADGTPI